MAKRSQRRPLRYDKDQGGCISGFMSIFDFRSGRTTRKLLADRRRANRQANASSEVGSSSPRLIKTMPRDKSHDIEEAEKGEAAAASNAVKTSVKKLMEEDMIHEQVPENQKNVSKGTSEECVPEHGSRTRKHRRRRSRASKNSIDMDINDGNSARYMDPENLCQQISEQKMPNHVDLESIIAELQSIHTRNADCLKSDVNNELDIQSDLSYKDVQEKLNAAIKVFMCHRPTNDKPLCEDGSPQISKEFIDAFQTISSNKELFLKLLQDPNSQLVKNMKSLEDDPPTNEQNFTQSNMLEDVSTKSEPDEPSTPKHRKFFRRRSRSQDSYPMEGDATSHSSSKIVILKPGPGSSRYPNKGDNMSTSLHSHFQLDSNIQDDKHTSQFSFTEIKRRLKHAMGKERLATSPNRFPHRKSERQNHGETEKGFAGDILEWRSPNRNHFYTEIFAKPSSVSKRGDKVTKSNDVEATPATENSEYRKQGESSIYMEAKKHLSEMLNDGEADTESVREKLPKSLGKILSLPEYKDSSMSSSEKDSEERLTDSTRLSPSGSSHKANKGTHQPVQEKLDGYSDLTEQTTENQIHKTSGDYHDKEQFPVLNCRETDEATSESFVEEIRSCGGDDVRQEGTLEITETTETIDVEEDEILNVIEIAISRSPTSEDKPALSNEKLKPVEEDQDASSPLASPSCSSDNSRIEDPEKSIDRLDRPSPISVLEPFFSEDDISPPGSVDRVEFEIHPRKIDFGEDIVPVNDNRISTITCVEEGESPFEYVEAVLLGSGLNWDEFLLRWLSSDQILEPSLFDEVELFSRRSHDQKLLFDCTNEALIEVCDSYFGGSTSISFGRQSIKPAPRGMNLIEEVWEGVEWHLFQHQSSKTLDQLVKMDMTRSKIWKNPHLDVQHTGIEMEEAIFEELIEDTVSCFISDDLDCLATPSGTGSHEIEIGIDS